MFQIDKVIIQGEEMIFVNLFLCYCTLVWMSYSYQMETGMGVFLCDLTISSNGVCRDLTSFTWRLSLRAKSTAHHSSCCWKKCHGKISSLSPSVAYPSTSLPAHSVLCQENAIYLLHNRQQLQTSVSTFTSLW